MPASLHLARFTPGAAARTVGRMARGRNKLLASPGLVSARLFMLAELDRYTGGVPNPVKWGLLCGFEHGAARDAFCAHGARRFTHDAREAWTVALDPVRVRKGDGLKGWVPDTAGAAKLQRDEPLMVMTYGRLRQRHFWDFTVNNQRIVKQMIGSPGLTMMVGLADHPSTRATFSLWRSQGDVVRFAYGPDGEHKPVQREAQDVPWAGDFFFARFRPVASAGTWHGSDPLAA